MTNQNLEEAHYEIRYLLFSTIIGMVFLDRNMHIRHFTHGIKKHLDLTEDDIGRAVGSFSAAYAEEDWEHVLSTSLRVLRSPTRVERIEVKNKKNGRYYLARITPYYNSAGMVDGVVISFVNISRRKRWRRRYAQASSTPCFLSICPARLYCTRSFAIKRVSPWITGSWT